MSVYEYALITAVLVSIIAIFFYQRGQSIHRVCIMIALLGVWVLHIGMDGYKWKWIPLYGLAHVLVLWSGITAYWQKADTWLKRHKQFGITAGALFFVCTGLCIMLGTYLFPAIRLHAPAGPYLLGTTSVHWIDEQREEIYPGSQGMQREVMVRIWYPADDDGDAVRADYGFDLSQMELSGDAPFLYKVIAQSNKKARSNAYEGVPPSAAKVAYPVVLFSPGFGGSNFMYASMLEELASHGYIVASIQHPYFSYFSSRFPDGRVARGMFDPGGAGDWERSEMLIEQILVKDVQFVIDRLEQLNRHDSSSLLAGKMDLSKLGMLGHSFGGAVAAQAMDIDPRIKAGIGLDGFLYGRKLVNGLNRPYMYVITGDTESFESRMLGRSTRSSPAAYGISSQEEYEQIAAEQAERHKLLLQNEGYTVTFHRANHYDFSDAPLYSPVIGSGSDERLYDKIDAVIRAFFDQQLKEQHSPLLERSGSEDSDFSISKVKSSPH